MAGLGLAFGPPFLARSRQENRRIEQKRKRDHGLPVQQHEQKHLHRIERQDGAQSGDHQRGQEDSQFRHRPSIGSNFGRDQDIAALNIGLFDGEIMILSLRIVCPAKMILATGAVGEFKPSCRARKNLPRPTCGELFPGHEMTKFGEEATIGSNQNRTMGQP